MKDQFIKLMRNSDPADIPQVPSPEPAGNREFTYGEKAVGLHFNPSGSGEVFQCKTAFAAEIDRMHKLSGEATDPEQIRLAMFAIRELQTAQMWAVKALTWG